MMMIDATQLAELATSKWTNILTLQMYPTPTLLEPLMLNNGFPWHFTPLPIIRSTEQIDHRLYKTAIYGHDSLHP